MPPEIHKIPGVCGGTACIARTRIPIWTLESYRRLGVTEAALLNSFPSLSVSDLASAWAYVAANKGEIDEDILRNDEE